MITNSLPQHAYDINLPVDESKKSHTQQPSEKGMHITLSKNQVLRLNGQRVSLNHLLSKVSSTTEVLLYADGHVTYQRVMTILSKLRQRKCTKIRLVMQAAS